MENKNYKKPFDLPDDVHATIKLFHQETIDDKKNEFLEES